ncbi:MAG: peptidoglycan bridge formation glycyltransferase FemA/FemB family protein [Bacilli bacterium]|nr:peptidoglycan bridge formation glycyltransferase FemA/FemB family protein [Bacilli bacterium]
MHIAELTELQFKNYSNLHTKKNFKQSIEYAQLKEVMKGYKKFYLALVDERNNVHGATLILEKKLTGKYKFGYVPSGFLINFYNYSLLEIFTNELKTYLKKLNYIYVRTTPLINYQVYNSDFILKENNSAIINSFKKLGYNYLPNTSKYKMVLQSNNIKDAYSHFKRSLKRNINDCLKKGITVHQGKKEDIPSFIHLIEKQDYFTKMEEIFNNPQNNFEFYYAKINPDIYINNYRYLLKQEEAKNEMLNNKLKNPNIKKTNNLLSKKMTSDRLVTKYHNEIINGTNIYKNYPHGIIIGVVGIISNKREIAFVTEGFENKFKHIRATTMIKWEIIKRHINNGYQIFDLGNISISNVYNTKNGFNGNIIEFSNTFDLVINEMFYKLYNYAKKDVK